MPRGGAPGYLGVYASGPGGSGPRGLRKGSESGPMRPPGVCARTLQPGYAPGPGPPSWRAMDFRVSFGKVMEPSSKGPLDTS